MRARHTPGATTDLRECTQCSLQYFAPSIPGDADFYEALMRVAPYESTRWEFRRVADQVCSSDAVLDVGCGEGGFLRTVANRANKAVGVDRNRDAIEKVRAAGLEAYDMDLREFAAGADSAFDVVCAFQTLEHLPAVGALLEPALRCLSRGGRLYLSVPNRNRHRFDPPETLEPLDLPPHHISRWAPEQFDALAREFDLGLTSLELAPPDFWTVEQMTMGRVERRGARLGRSLARGVARVHRHAMQPAARRRYKRDVASGAFHQAGIFGHTMLAEFRA